MIVGGGIAPARNFTRHDVQRPRPPQVAVMSIDAACAARRIVVPGGRLSSRRAPASRGSVRMTRETAMPGHCNLPPLGPAAMLRAMDRTPTLDLDTLRCFARVAGFDWSDEELERLRPAIEASRRILGALESAPVADVEPTTLYRVL